MNKIATTPKTHQTIVQYGADIDKKVFAEQMSMLGLHLGGIYPPALMETYYDLLNESMGTEEFYAATRAAFRVKLYRSELINFLETYVKEQTKTRHPTAQEIVAEARRKAGI